MYGLPKSDYVKVEYLRNSLSSMTKSYKLFFMKSLIDEIKNDNYEISFKILAARMIENSFYIIRDNKVYLGKKDKLNDIICDFISLDNIPSSFTKRELFDYILSNIDEDSVTYLMRYVVYRIIRPTFEDELYDIEKDNDKQKKIEELAKEDLDCIYRIDSKNNKIIINLNWFKYFKDNETEIEQWIWFNILEYIIKRVRKEN